jgi:hypothetical protein
MADFSQETVSRWLEERDLAHQYLDKISLSHPEYDEMVDCFKQKYGIIETASILAREVNRNRDLAPEPHVEKWCEKIAEKG